MTTTKNVERELSSADNEGTVTDQGFDSYATAWRYLGAYNSCYGGGRRLKNNGGYSGCRKILWAAYYDPNYSGEEIGEYQFYANGEWDNSTCTSDRCAKMDCHDPYTSNWELIGVYKESVSFGDDTWFEQLFKHQGYCLWDGDKEDTESGDGDSWKSSSYRFMQAMRKELPSGCIGVSYFGSTYYIDVKPMQYGQMTLGVYTDSSCQEEAGYSFYDYQKYAASYLTATASSGAFDTWNNNMDAYKICQPCRAYNRQQTYRRNRERRYLGEQNDGQGDEEQNGYNCYDDADYQNCNQCYKFETHTDMEEVDSSDLEMASDQGTILEIEYDGVVYGSGTVGDVQSYEEVEEGEEGENSYELSYQSSNSYQLSNSHQMSNRRHRSYSSSSSSSSSTKYSLAGGAFLFLVFGFITLRRFRKVTQRRIVLATGEGTKPSTTSPPLV